jgi:long-chain acyl-CoA synthetase
VYLDRGLRRSARLYPEKLAIIEGQTRLTYAELVERVDRLANSLIEQGLNKGDRVAIFSYNSFRFNELYYGVNVAGGITVPLNYRLSIPELEYIIKDSDCSFLFCSPEFVEQSRELAEICPSLKTLVVMAEDTDTPEFLVYEKLIQAASAERPAVAISETDPSSIFYTGGTTGRSKGVIVTQRHLVQNSYTLLMHGVYSHEDVYLTAGAMFHIGGTLTYSFSLLASTIVYIPQFEASLVLETIEREKITHTLLVPTMLNAVINHPDVHTRDLSSWKGLMYSASAISPDVLRVAMNTLPCKFLQAYGMTEAGSFITLLEHEDHIFPPTDPRSRRIASAGIPVYGVDLRIVDDQDQDLPLGTPGEVIVHCGNVMQGYLNMPEETEKALRGGWYHTGDIGYLDKDGYLYLVDRKKDMIITGGENVYSTEVENALYTHPAVLEAAVIGVPDQKWGEVVMAVVTLKPGQQVTAEELMEHCRTLIARYKVPKIVNFVAALPKNATGKMIKRVLRDQFWAGKERLVN